MKLERWKKILMVFAALALILGGIIGHSEANKNMEINDSIRENMKDDSFMDRMKKAGYRIEKDERGDHSKIIARCARANEAGPIPCDPAPIPDGLAAKAIRVVP